MTIRESEIRRRLKGDDDDDVAATLHRFFRPTPRFTAPLLYEWLPLPDLDVVLGDGEGGGAYERAARGIIDLANATDKALRGRRFDRRRRRAPQWPLVLCEGDSWLSHPFIHELGDFLANDPRNAFHLLNRAAAGDRLVKVAAEREHEAELAKSTFDLFVLSGGGNDLLLDFGDFLRPGPHPADAAPATLIREAMHEHMTGLMDVMRGLLLGVRRLDATMPILVHGYDYLRVAAPGRGPFLGPHFDQAGIEDPQQRQATLDHIIDRYNEYVRGAAAAVPDVEVVELRGIVSEDQWYDEIHPNREGFRGLAEAMGTAIRRRLAQPAASEADRV
ncbi:MAG: SGNH/GDSL hydrolase family protein [Deltaproteobacteria bacterium]|nr:SGNH/GDSL hydrolase family protein [Deltaproteobacteria bacterium]